MNKTMIKKMLMFALAMVGGSVWAEVPQPVYTWDGTDGTEVDTIYGKKVYTISGKVINTVELGLNVVANNFTFSYWSKMTDGATWRNYAGFSDETGGLMIQKSSDTTINVYGSGDANDKIPTGEGGNGCRFTLSSSYQLVTFVSLDGTLKVYVDGVPVAETTPIAEDGWATFSSDTPMEYFGLGIAPSKTGGSAGNGYIPAYIADARIYNQALTSEQVSELYNSYVGEITKTDKSIISLNISKYGGSNYDATLYDTYVAGLEPVPGTAWINLDGGASGNVATNLYWDGIQLARVENQYSVEYASKETYRWTWAADGILKTYLDDGEVDGHRAKINVANIPFAKYSVIVYCATDEQDKQFSPVTVNDETYTVNAEGVTVKGTDTFGASRGIVAKYATSTSGNAIKIDNLSGDLSIQGGANSNDARGGIAAIQIVSDKSTARVQGETDASKIEWLPNLDSESDAAIVAGGDAVINLDEQISANTMEIIGGSLKFIGEAGLAFNETFVKADTDVSEVNGTVSLGDVTIESGKKLTVVQTNVCSSITRQANSTLKITGDITNVNDLLFADNCMLETSGNVVLLDQTVTETLKGRGWVLSGGESSVSNLYMAAGAQWANAGNKSMLTLKNGAKLTVTSDAAVIGRAKTDGAMMFAECGNGSLVTITGEGTELKVPNGAINLSRDGATTATVSGGALLQAYKLGGTFNSSTLTIDGATLRLGKDGAQDGIVKMTACKMILTNATLSAAGDWSVAVDSTASQIEVRDTLTVELNGKNVVLRNMIISENVDLIVKGPGVLNASELNGRFASCRITDGAEVIVNAGSEGSVDVAEGSCVKLILSDGQFALEYSAFVSGSGSCNFVRASDDSFVVVTTGVTRVDNEFKYKTTTPVWKLTDESSDWDNEDLWSNGVRPTSGNIVIDTSLLTTDVSVTVPSEFTSVKITGNEKNPAAINFVKKSGSIEIYGNVILSGEFPDNLIFGSGSEVVINNVNPYDVTVPSGVSVILNGAEAEGEEPTAKPFGKFIVSQGGSLKTRGYLSLTLQSNGEFEVCDGTAVVTAAQSQSVKGTVTIKKGATLRSASNDAVAYNGSTIVHVHGELDMFETRWTIGGSSQLHLYGGALVYGSGDGSNGILDLFRAGNVVCIHKSNDEIPLTTSEVSGFVRVRDGSAQINIDDGAYVTFSGGLGHNPGEACKLTRTGDGGFIGTNYLKGVILDLGKHANVLGRFVSMSGENELIIQGLDNGNTSFCSNDTKDDPVIRVESGSTLKLSSRDYSGWNGSVTEHGWIVNNGTLKLAAKDGGSRFFREHIVIGQGSNTIVEQKAAGENNQPPADRAIALYGGAPSAELAQIQLLEGSSTITTNGTAEAKVLYLGNDSTGGYGDKGAGILVGKGAELTIEPTVKGGDKLVKWGDGMLKFTGPMGEYSGRLTLNRGKISIAPSCGFTGEVVTEAERVTVSKSVAEDGTVVYRLSPKYFYIRIR